MLHRKLKIFVKCEQERDNMADSSSPPEWRDSANDN
jgi:hypothetical protein